MKKIILTLLLILFSFPIFALGEKLGSFFEDQLDIIDDGLKQWKK
tara:strand:+ start:134 stop:268 length:135 start_codon:yes stop_codon:yes gene_type:complete